MPKAKTVKAKVAQGPAAKSYDFKDELPLRPDVGLQAQFRQKKPPAKYRYDPSLDPQLSWDLNSDRERAENLIREIAEAGEALAKGNHAAAERARQAAVELRRISRSFLNWTGKAENAALEVPTLPLFVHERLSTEAILKSVEGRKPQKTLSQFFADPELDVTDRVLKAYSHKGRWTNRITLGDSLVVMNSLLRYEGLGGQVQMVYVDPPYGVKFGSNFQPFVRNKNVEHAADSDLTREPEMVQAYRDTWELGIHSYLTYLRDRLLLARELLHETGSIFVQISDENLHHVRELLDEIFGSQNYCSVITLTKAAGQSSKLLASVNDYLLWYAKDATRVKYHPLYKPRPPIDSPTHRYICVETPDGKIHDLSLKQKLGQEPIPEGKWLRLVTLTSQTGTAASRFPYEFDGKTFTPPGSRGWSTSREGLDRVKSLGRMYSVGTTLMYKNYHSDFAFRPINSLWDDIRSSGFGEEKLYVVQTQTEVLERCILMTTDPGDLVLDPTCGSGTTAYMAESWGRRWITIDTSRVPLALARQRLLTATFPYFALRDEKLGPAAGFVYKRRQNKRGEESGGIVPHITLKSMAQGEEPENDIIVDRPEVADDFVRVTGAFTVEATIPAPALDVEADGGIARSTSEGYPQYLSRMIEVLRRAPILRLVGGKSVEFRNIRPPARALELHAIAEMQNGKNGTETKTAAVVFGPENGAVTQQLIHRAAQEANVKNYAHLYVIGFAIQDAATKQLRNAEDFYGMPVTYVQATMDILMGDLLKTTRSSQIFSVTGLPDVDFVRLKKKNPEGDPLLQVRLLAVDTFDPITMEPSTLKGENVPCWMIDSDYDELCFRANQVFFPRTGAWENLKRSLKGSFSDSLWDHLAGIESEPFVAGEHKRIAVKVIDERGNELLVVKDLKEAKDE